jgi:hypothetical protein
MDDVSSPVYVKAPKEKAKRRLIFQKRLPSVGPSFGREPHPQWLQLGAAIHSRNSRICFGALGLLGWPGACIDVFLSPRKLDDSELRSRPKSEENFAEAERITEMLKSQS